MLQTNTVGQSQVGSHAPKANHFLDDSPLADRCSLRCSYILNQFGDKTLESMIFLAKQACAIHSLNAG